MARLPTKEEIKELQEETAKQEVRVITFEELLLLKIEEIKKEVEEIKIKLLD